jgi:PncC family amidohydrolase
MYSTKEIAGIRKYLSTHQHTISVAESVTSGHLQAALSLAEGALEIFQGGLTAYNLGQKARHLHVDPIHAQTTNCVSQKVADAMAIHVAQLFSSYWGVAITGYAAPVPELGITELFAFYAVALEGRVVLRKKIFTREQEILKAQLDYTNMLLKDLHEYLAVAESDLRQA